MLSARIVLRLHSVTLASDQSAAEGSAFKLAVGNG
jgi:hypothetical protein